ncbi:MAG TPA: hypothetical protein VG326_04255 [Tepidisphaeraceae bacterium]|jgi:hypothetical protein|nr:hypothetical protein [Tepidisphaeraceae bacterium]
MTEEEAGAAAEKLAKQAERAQGLFNEAVDCAEGLTRVSVGKLHTHYYGSDDRNVPVQAKFKERSFLISAHLAEPQELKAGLYKLSELVAVTSSGRAAPDRQHRFACMCTIPNQQIATTLLFPDISALYANSTMPTDLQNFRELRKSDVKLKVSGVERALRTTDIRSNDNFLGWVRLQIEFSPKDPRLLVAALQEARRVDGSIGGEAKTQQEVFEDRFRGKIDESGGSATFTTSRPGMIGWFLDHVKGKQEFVDGKLMEPTQTITFADLYPLLRFELMRVVSTAVRQCSAEGMYNDEKVQVDLQRDIQNRMGVTLQKYGLEMTRVSAFQFVSEAFQEKLELAEEVEKSRGLKELMSGKVDIDIEALEIRDKFLKAKIQSDHVLKIAELKNESVVEDQKLTGEISRQQQKDAAERKKKLLDTDVDLQNRSAELEFAKKNFEMYRLVNDYKAEKDHQRREQLAALPADKLLPMLMLENPALQEAFIAAKRAESTSDRVDAERRIRDEMMALNREHGGNLHELMVEAAKQIGHVTGKLLENKERPKEMRIVEIEQKD